MDCLLTGNSENGFDDNGVKYALIQASWVEIAPREHIGENDPKDCQSSHSDAVSIGTDEDEATDVAHGEGKSVDDEGENILFGVFTETVSVVDDKETRQLILNDQNDSERWKYNIIKEEGVKNVDGGSAIRSGDMEAKEADYKSGQSAKDVGELNSIMQLYPSLTYFWSIFCATIYGQIPVSLTIGILLLVPSVGTGVGGTLTSVPVNTLVAVGETARINCSTNMNHPLYWSRTPPRSDERQWLYYGTDGFDISNADARFSIEKDEESGRYDLIISDVQHKDAGQYACFEESGLGGSTSAEIVVSDSIECTTRIPSDGVMGNNVFGIEQDFIQVSCSLTYTGNLSPTLEWSWPGSDDQSNGHNVSAAKSSVTSIFKLIPIKEHNGDKLQCKANIEGAAPHTIDSGLHWESETINVKYAEFIAEEVDVCPGVELSLVCNPQCSYSFEESKDHQCRCRYAYFDKRTQQDYQIPLYAARCVRDNDRLPVVLLSVSAVAVTVVAIVVICYLKKKKTKRSPGSTESCNGKESSKAML